MVSFTCDACGQTVKKNKVEKHYQIECRNCSVLSCIDCGKDFHGDEYVKHTSCISEAEKYQGKLYQPKDKANKGELKQQEWIKKVQDTSSGVQNPKLKGYLNKIQEYSNVPRKKAKFINFCKNSIRVFDQKVLEQLWEAFNPTKNEEKAEDQNKKEIPNKNATSSLDFTTCNLENDNTDHTVDNNSNIKDKKTKKRKRDKDLEQIPKANNLTNGTTRDIESVPKKKKKKSKKTESDEGSELSLNAESHENHQTAQGKFNWHKAIKMVLKDADEDGIPTKKLKKKVIAEYYAFGTNHQATSQEECSALFNQKLNGYKKAKSVKDRVFYKK